MATQFGTEARVLGGREGVASYPGSPGRRWMESLLGMRYEAREWRGHTIWQVSAQCTLYLMNYIM